MSESFANICDSCGESMLPNVSQADEDGCLWICINPGCPEMCAGELETADLMEAGVPKALAGRLVRLVDYYEDTIGELRGSGAAADEDEASPPAGSRERAQAGLASLCSQVRELRRRSALAAAAARQLSLELIVSYQSNEFSEAQDAQHLLAAVAALCGAAGHAVTDAEERLLDIDPQLPGRQFEASP